MKKLFLVLSIAGVIVTGAAGYIMAEDDPHYINGKKFFKQQKYDEAIEEFKKGLTTNSKEDKKVLLASIGYSYHMQNKFTEAVEFYNESLKIDPDYRLSIENLGILYFAGLKDYEKGMEYNIKAEKHITEKGIIYYNMARYYSLKNDKEKVFRSLWKALYYNFRNFESIKETEDFANLKTDSRFIILVNNFQFIIEGDKYKKQADESYSRAEYDNSIKLYQKSFDLYGKALWNKSIYISLIYKELGSTYNAKGEYDRAIEFHNKALESKLEIFGEKHPDVAECYNELGECYRGKADFNKAISYYNKSLVICNELYGENFFGIPVLYNNIALVYHSKGDNDRSIEYSNKALNMYIKIFGENHTYTAGSYNNLGLAYIDKEDYDRAIGYHEKALAIYLEVLGDKHPLIATSYNNLGLAYENKGDYDRAIGYYEKSLAIKLDVLGDKHPDRANSYNNLGTAYFYKGDYDLAIGYLEKALAIRLEVLGSIHASTATSYNNLGKAYEHKGDYDRAKGYYGKALDISKASESNQDTVLISKNFGKLYIQIIRYKESFSAFLTGIEIIEKVRKLNLSGGTDFTSRNINSYYHAANAGYLNNDLNSMFNISERMRAMGYIERLSLKGAMDAAGISTEQSKKLLQLKDDIERLSSLRQKLISVPVSSMNEIQKKEHDAKFEKVSNELAQAVTDFTKLDTEFMKNEKYKLLRDTSVVSVTEAEKLCGKDGAIIEYIIPEKPDKYMKPYAIIITGSTIKAVELDSDYDYSDQIGKYRKAIKDSKKTESDQLGAELYTKLIEPANSFINSTDIKKLIIVPDGSLAFLPFDSIKTKENKYLSERYELNLTPSVTVSSMIKNRKYDKKDNLMAFGGGLYSSSGESKTRGESSFRGIAVDDKQKEKLAAKAYNSPMEYYNAQQLGWADLPGTEREVTVINEKIYNKKNTDVYTGSKVSEENLKSLSKDGRLKKYSSIHLACHGYYDPEYPGYSAVVFSEVSGKMKNSNEDGYMSVEETALLNLQSDIVVLSACETGLGRMVSGDGVIGLTRAFQVAGSNRVLVTLWPVSDDATEAFMISFYGKVKSGLSYSQALVKVKDEFRRSGGKSGSDYSAPYFWAGFVLYE